MTMTDYMHELRDKERPIELRLAIEAVSKGRPRFGKHSTFTPAGTRKFESMFKRLAQTISSPPFTCPVEVLVVITVAIPKSYKGKKRAAAEQGMITPPRGDLDNKVKAITDALNGVAYLDDVQIAKTQSEKQFGNAAHVYVKIRRCGLSMAEIENYGHGYDRDTKRGAKVG